MTIELVKGLPTTTKDFSISEEEFKKAKIGETIHNATITSKRNGEGKFMVDLCYSTSAENCLKCKTPCLVRDILSI